MTRSSRDRLYDIQQAIEAIEAHVGGSLDAPQVVDLLNLHAVLFNFMVIGEAAKGVGEEARRAAPDVNWTDLAGMRDIIAHHYFRVQKQLIEDTIRGDLPALKLQVDRLLAET